jgi:hypothetical protein
MKSLILTIAMTVVSMVSYSQWTEVPNQLFPEREWYQIEGEKFEGIYYITSDDKWIMDQLEMLLEEDDISILSPDKEIKDEDGEVIYMEWEYDTDQDGPVIVSYVKNLVTSDISFQIVKQD